MSDLNEMSATTLHDVMQPLNIIRLSCGNIRTRMLRNPGEDTNYVIEKMDKIEQQVLRATQLLQEIKQRNGDNETADAG